jgi:hypothetical protein
MLMQKIVEFARCRRQLASESDMILLWLSVLKHIFYFLLARLQVCASPQASERLCEVHCWNFVC